MAVAAPSTSTMAWLSEIKRSITADSRSNGTRHKKKPTTLGIIAFDTAKTMARLVCLHRTLSDEEVCKLRKEIMTSRGVSYLNSKDQGFLLYLACAEILEDLDSAAVTVARLGRKCADMSLSRFDLVYSDIKMGIIDLCKMKFASRDATKVVQKVDRLVHTTSALYTALECLAELEISEKRLQIWRKTDEKTSFDLFNEKISWQRKHVKTLREASLWGQTFDKAVSLMARTVCIVYARVCFVFGPHISVLPFFTRTPQTLQKKYICALPKNGRATKSGPIAIAITPRQKLIRAFTKKSTALLSENIRFGTGFGIDYHQNRQNFRFEEMGKHNSVYINAPSSSLGGSGLALRYANVILLAEKYLHTEALIGEDARENLYEMLPTKLRSVVRSKIKQRLKDECRDRIEEGQRREELKEMLGWLAPMARDTVKWQAARNMEKHTFDGKPTTLLLQTLHFSDREKTEEAIGEVLVGWSCVYRDQHRRAIDWYCRKNELSICKC